MYTKVLKMFEFHRKKMTGFDAVRLLIQFWTWKIFFCFGKIGNVAFNETSNKMMVCKFLHDCLRVFFFYCTRFHQIPIILKHICLRHSCDSNRYFYSGLEWTWESWQWRSTSHFQDLQNWSLTLRCSKVSYSGHALMVGVQSAYSIAHQRWINWLWKFVFNIAFNH